MEAIAKATNVKISSQKAKLVMDLIRGRAYSEARDILRFTNKRAAGLIFKVLETARQRRTAGADRQCARGRGRPLGQSVLRRHRHDKVPPPRAPCADGARLSRAPSTTATSLWSSRARAARARPWRRNKFS